MPCPGPQGEPRRLSYKEMAWGRVVGKGFLEEVKPVLSPCKGRNRKMDLSKVEEGCLWRGNGTHERAPRPETS